MEDAAACSSPRCIGAGSRSQQHRLVPRQHLSARLTDEAMAGWDALSTRRNVTVTAVLEAIGLALALNPALMPEAVVEQAKAIDRERRSRR